MITKQIDRYVSRSFLLPFAGILVLIFVLYGSFDLLKKIDELQQAGAGRAIPLLAKYYAYLFPVFILDTIPVVVVVSAGLALVPMAKNRELLILKSSGISIYRVALPIFFWTLIISASMLWMRESVVPVFSKKKELLARKLEGKKSESRLLQDQKYNRRFFVDSYNFSNDVMDKVTVVEQYTDQTIKRIIEADRGEWRDGQTLVLESVDIREYDPEGLPTGNSEVKKELTLPTSLSRFDFLSAHQGSLGGQSLSMPLDKLVKRMRASPHIPEYRVAFHSRLASTFIPFLLLLVGIPVLVGFERSAKNRFLGVLICVLVAGAHYVLVFVSNSMGETGVMPPTLAGWLPIIVTGPVGITLFESMLT